MRCEKSTEASGTSKENLLEQKQLIFLCKKVWRRLVS